MPRVCRTAMLSGLRRVSVHPSRRRHEGAMLIADFELTRATRAQNDAPRAPAELVAPLHRSQAGTDPVSKPGWPSCNERLLSHGGHVSSLAA